MSKRTIKVGDKIKVTDALPGSGYKNGDILTVVNIYHNGNVDTTIKELGGCYFLYASEYELITEPIGQVIKFEDIRKGDRIRVTFDDGDLTNIGVASELSADWWYTPKGRLLVAFQSVAVITLLDRPKPELPTELGSVIIATEVRGVKGRWELYLLSERNWIAVDRIDGYRYHDPKRITEWELAKIVPIGAE